MPHIDITMIPGRNNEEKLKLAKKVQKFISDELNIEDKFVSVSIEDIEIGKWNNHIENMKDKHFFIKPIL